MGVWTAVRLQKEEIGDTKNAILEQNLSIADQSRLMGFQYAAGLFFSHLDAIDRSFRDIKLKNTRTDSSGSVESMLSGEDAVAAMIGFFQRAYRGEGAANDPFIQRSADAFSPLAASVRIASAYVWRTFADASSRDQYLSLLALRVPHSALCALCFYIEHTGDRALAVEMERSNMLQFLGPTDLDTFIEEAIKQPS